MYMTEQPMNKYKSIIRERVSKHAMFPSIQRARPEEIMLFHFFEVFPNTDAFEFCFYILKAGLLY